MPHCSDMMEEQAGETTRGEKTSHGLFLLKGYTLWEQCNVLKIKHLYKNSKSQKRKKNPSTILSVEKGTSSLKRSKSRQLKELNFCKWVGEWGVWWTKSKLEASGIAKLLVSGLWLHHEALIALRNCVGTWRDCPMLDMGSSAGPSAGHSWTSQPWAGASG